MMTWKDMQRAGETATCEFCQRLQARDKAEVLWTGNKFTIVRAADDKDFTTRIVAFYDEHKPEDEVPSMDKLDLGFLLTQVFGKLGVAHFAIEPHPDDGNHYHVFAGSLAVNKDDS